ncbi:hypothetical protein F0562_023251 [Nyssa sinensis]|uniref:FIST C-domain domain-containing protein n=1 Tax=Nyssa sinensis TaxID=561372 RepID=A0A5J5BHA9_9ASTE|nr:hypothetical protein F0562_023251 [Nyssa sinensis]
MPRNRRREKQKERQRGGGIDLIGEDLLQKILSRLPALSFASAACVSRSWNVVCQRVICRPKLSSAISLNPEQKVAVKEVLDKVLSEPIRPHFAIACIGPSFCLRLTHQLITEKLGSRTPVITCESSGIIGRDALTEEFQELQWDIATDEDHGAEIHNLTHGITLTVGYIPGLTVEAIPLLQSIEAPRALRVAMVDNFVMDIREYTASVSGCTSPAGIILFEGWGSDVKPIIDKLDYAMSMETSIVGGQYRQFLYRRRGDNRNPTRSAKYIAAAVALLFVRDRNKPHGIGETQFHVALSTGLSPIGLTHKAVSVREKQDGCSTWLTARREGLHDILDGESMLNYINDEIGDRIEYPVLYIGVMKRRKCSIGSEKARWVTSLAFHEVTGGDEEYLFVNGVGIKTGDSFHFYQSDSSTALSFCQHVSENLRRLKEDCNHKNCHHVRTAAASGDVKEVFGGIIFSCCGRGESFFGRSNVDSSPFLENFPGVPLAGTFCGGEIGRASLRLL